MTRRLQVLRYKKLALETASVIARSLPDRKHLLFNFEAR